MRSGHEATHEQRCRNAYPTFDEVIGMDGQHEDDFVEWERFLEDMPTPVHDGSHQQGGSSQVHEGGPVDRRMDHHTSPTLPTGHPSYQRTKIQRTESLPETRRRQSISERRITERQMSFPVVRSYPREDGAIFRMNSGSMSHGPAYTAAQSKLDSIPLQRSDSGTPMVRVHEMLNVSGSLTPSLPVNDAHHADREVCDDPYQQGIAQKVAISLQRQDSIGKGNYPHDLQMQKEQVPGKLAPMKPGPAGKPDPVPMPSVDALFKDISSKSPERRWDRRPPNPAGQAPDPSKEVAPCEQALPIHYPDSERILEAAIASIRTRLGRNGSEASKRAAAGLGPQKPNNYLGVSRVRWTAHWDASVKNASGERISLGSFNSEEAAARAYDIAALKLFGEEAKTNFSSDDYEEGLGEMEELSIQEFIEAIQGEAAAEIQKHSRFRGVYKAEDGKWEARWMESPRRSSPDPTDASTSEGRRAEDGLEPHTPKMSSHVAGCTTTPLTRVKTETLHS